MIINDLFCRGSSASICMVVEACVVVVFIVCNGAIAVHNASHERTEFVRLLKEILKQLSGKFVMFYSPVQIIKFLHSSNRNEMGIPTIMSVHQLVHSSTSIGYCFVFSLNLYFPTTLTHKWMVVNL